jgi:hypothetical protein
MINRKSKFKKVHKKESDPKSLFVSYHWVNQDNTEGYGCDLFNLELISDNLSLCKKLIEDKLSIMFGCPASVVILFFMEINQ